MPRAKGGPKTRRRHKKTMKQAKGFVGGGSSARLSRVASVSLRLEVREKALDRLLVGLVDEHRLAEPALLLARLVDEDVT